MQVFIMRTYMLMREKEQTVMNEQTARGWLNQAANIDSVIRAGTLRSMALFQPTLLLCILIFF